jgi:hypothetical protein
VIIYMIDDEDVQISHVCHGRQDIEGRVNEEGLDWPQTVLSQPSWTGNPSPESSVTVS